MRDSRLLQPAISFWHALASTGIQFYGEAVALAYYLLLSRSITHVQRMSIALERGGIKATILRPPLGLTDKGCSYALRVVSSNMASAMERLRDAQVMPVRIFYTAGDGAYQEFVPR